MKNAFRLCCRGLLLVSLSVLLSGCFIKPYKFDLYQGNIITPDKIAQVQPGMSQEQVRYILGTPLLNDVFENERWDYVYVEKPGKGGEARRHLAIFFINGRVDTMTEDLMGDVA